MADIKLTDPMMQLEDDIEVLEKYKEAGAIAARVLDGMIKNIKLGKTFKELIEYGERRLESELAASPYKSIKYKGLCFPICLCKNNYLGQTSTIDCEVEEGDLLKIELGVHIDGYPAIIAYPTVVKKQSEKINDRRKDVMKAAFEASREIFQIMKPGKKNLDVVRILEKYAIKYNCSLPVTVTNKVVPGIISYQISRCVLDGYNEDEDENVHRFITNKQHPDPDYALRECELEPDEVYAIDVLYSTGKGKLDFDNEHSTIFRRDQDRRVNLKLKTSRATLSQIGKDRFPVDMKGKMDNKFKLGLKECVKDLVAEYPSVYEQEGEYVARVKFTVIVRDEPILVTGRPASSELDKLSE